ALVARFPWPALEILASLVRRFQTVGTRRIALREASAGRCAPAAFGVRRAVITRRRRRAFVRRPRPRRWARAPDEARRVALAARPERAARHARLAASAPAAARFPGASVTSARARAIGGLGRKQASREQRPHPDGEGERREEDLWAP